MAAGGWRLLLTVRSGPDKGKSCAVDRDEVTVGKLPACDLVLHDDTVSRQHLKIRRLGSAEDPSFEVEDLGSTNGTFVDGAQIRRARLEPGARLKAGTVELEFAPRRQRDAQEPWAENYYGPLLGRSLAMRRLFALIDRVAPTDATVLLEGETGSGKGAIARALHDASNRRDGPFVVVDCGAVQRQLVESELFGHEKGAFSHAFERRQGAFELASGGTVFIDELGELDLELQPKLLRVLDAGEVRRVGGDKVVPVDLRVVAASRRNLEREVARGAFREDLFFRLSVVTMKIEPLRERPDDIALLAQRFAEELAARRGQPARSLSADVLDRLTSHDWPGNVRELKSTIERALLLSAGRPGQSLQVEMRSSSTSGAPKPAAVRGFDPTASFSEAKESWIAEREEAYVRWLLEDNEGNVSQAAREAKMDRKYLHKLVRKYGLK